MQFRWDGFVLDIPAHRLAGPDGDIHVEPQVFDVLVHLVTNRERVVTKAELLDEVWGDQFVSESALTTRIKTARRVLGDDGRAQRYIRNVHGRGYQFVGDTDSAMPSSRPAEVLRETVPARSVHLGMSIAVDEEFGFVGRTAELDSIDSMIGDLSQSAQVFIGGAPGLGKSRLALHVLDRAMDGAIVCAGRCDQSLTSGLQPVRDAIGQLAATDPIAFRSWCLGIEGQLLHLIPSVGDVLDGQPVPVDGYASIDVLLTVISRASDTGPMFMLIDDLQWSDEPTRSLIAQLHRRFGSQPIATICTYRSGSADLRASAKEWISSQRRQANAVRIDLDELEADAARELAGSVLGPDIGDVDSLLERTGGHALFLTETIRDRALGAEASGSVGELIASRFERLDPTVSDLVRVAAVYGPSFPFDIVGAAADLDPASALEAIDLAIDAELIHETESPSEFRFSHQLVPEAIRSSLSNAVLARTHYRLAEVLEDAGANDATIAWYHLGSVPLVQVEHALERAVAAAESALGDNEFDRAIRLLERCLEADPQTRQRAELLAMAGTARVLSGRSIAAVPEFDEAAELARRNGWVDVLVTCALGRYGGSPYRNISERETVALLREALDALPPGPSIERARLTAKLAVFLTFDEPLALREQMSTEALAMAADADVVERMRVLEAHCVVLSCPSAIDRLEVVLDELQVILAETGSYWADAAAPETAHLMRARGTEFRAVAEIDEVRARKQPIAEWRDLALRATIATFDGDLETARNSCDDAASIGWPYWGESAAALQAFTHLFIDQVSGNWERSPEIFRLILEFTRSPRILPSAGLALAMDGDVSAATKIADEMVTRRHDFGWFGEYILGGNMLSGAAELGLAIDHDELCEIAEEHLLPVSQLVLGLPWGPSLAAADSLAQLARRRGDDDAAAAHGETARQMYTSLQAPALLARFERIFPT